MAAYLIAGLVAIGLYPALTHSAKPTILAVVQFSAGAAVFAGIGLHRPASRAGWMFLGGGSLLIGAGDGSWVWYERTLHQPIPYPGISDAMFIPGYLALLAGLFVLIKRRAPGRDIASLLDALIVAVALAFAISVLITGPLMRNGHLSTGQAVISVVYPSIDIALIALLARLLFTSRDAPGSLWLLAAGAVSLLAGDTAYAALASLGDYHVGDLPDPLWMAATTLVGAAALHPSMRLVAVEAEEKRRGITRARLAVLLAAIQVPAAVVLAAVLAGLQVSNWADFGLAGGFALLVSVRVATLARGLQRLVLTDALTGLASREALIQRLDRGPPGRRGSPTRSALMYIDLDRFKMVNDTFGHETGDRLLVEVGRRLRGLVREGDTLARLGGDEFAILFQDLPRPADAERLAERLVDSFSSPFLAGAVELTVGVSVGLVDLDGVDGVTALRNADIAMYAAKASGSSRWMRYAPPMHATLVEMIAVESELRHAIARGEMELHYQPIVSLSSGRMVAVEALVRWEHPRRGQLPPGEFVPVAERNGQIVELGAWVLATACRQLAQWNGSRPGAPALTMSVNVSARQLTAPGFVELVEDTLTANGVDPASLCLEITESTLLASADRARSTVAALRQSGISVALDDFGTSYASLSYLQQLNVDVVKIDKSFVDGLGSRLEETTIVAAVIGLAGAIRLSTVAEGIESADQLVLLRDMGCNSAQGYYLSRPVPADLIGDQLDADWCGPDWAQPDLPPVPLHEDRPSLRVVPDRTTSRRYRVLLADDCENDRMLQRRELEATGAFDVVAEATDGTMAVRLAALHQPHLILLDLKMPGLDGLAALPRLLLAAPGAKVVFLSGYASPRSVDQALAVGASAFYKKGVPDLAVALLALFRPANPSESARA